MTIYRAGIYLSNNFHFICKTRNKYLSNPERYSNIFPAGNSNIYRREIDNSYSTLMSLYTDSPHFYGICHEPLTDEWTMMKEEEIG